MNLPVDAIASFNAEGEIRPIRIRIETEEQERQTINIDRVIVSNKTNYAGFRVINFICRTVINDLEKDMELSYMVDTQKWSITKM